MELEIFKYIENVLTHLEKIQDELDTANDGLEHFFEGLLEYANEGYLNINSRVKGKRSLKEKILRHDYFNKYKTVDGLFDNLSDLIGIRLECRFITDETAIYKVIKKYFSAKSDTYEGFFYPPSHPDILLELESKQPKSQKNGVKIYRIDGKYITEGRVVNFEVQIKSLVNIFWSEIEHKIIYKNYNYIIADRFYKDIMGSIKNSLSTIDQQLLLISNQFDKSEGAGRDGRKEQLQKLISKGIYDLFAYKMKSSMGILVDFRKSCDTIVKYVFRDVLLTDDYNHHATATAAFERLNHLDQEEIEFMAPIVFERHCSYDGEFETIVGRFIEQTVNEQFQWTLFFKILFKIEVYSNATDLENFVQFYKNRFYKGINTSPLAGQFGEDERNEIVDRLMLRYAKVFTEMDTVEVLYDNMIDQVIRIFNMIIDTIGRNVACMQDWYKEEELYLQLLELRVYSTFGMDIEATRVLDFLEDVRQSDSNIEIHKSIVKYLDKL